VPVAPETTSTSFITDEVDGTTTAENLLWEINKNDNLTQKATLSACAAA
jgi:hypothetical protein